MSSQNDFNVISTFSGCGGSSMGYQLAGGKVILAVELDDHAVETYRNNFPETPIYHGDIHNLNKKKILELAPILKTTELDILDGSPPCQGFSMAGKRQMNDLRNQLYHEFVRILRLLKPHAFVLENVPGLVRGNMKLIFADMMKQLKASGYQVKARVLNAQYYNVPQSRNRLIIIGYRDDLKIIPSHPKPVTKPIPASKALIGVNNTEEDIQPLKLQQRKTQASYKMWQKLDYGGFNKVHPKGYWYNQIKLNPDKPSPTITSTVWYMGGSGLVHWLEPRYLTIAEIKRLHTYPDTFKTHGKHVEQWARIGNSVPPQLTKNIAQHIIKEIET